MRSFGHAQASDRQFTFRPGAYVILPKAGSLLLTYQGGIHQELQLPGGGIDSGESTIAALHREVVEETGWRIARPVFLCAYRRFVFMPEYEVWAEKLCKIYVADPIRQISAPSEKDHTACWLGFEQAFGQMTNDIDREILHSWTKDRFRS